MIGCMILGGLATLGLMRYFHFRRHFGGGCGFRRLAWHHGGGHHGGGGDCWSGGEYGGRDEWAGGLEGGHHRGGRHQMPFVASFLSERLEATPAQERAIRNAVEEFRAELGALRGELPKTRADLAAALRKPAFDEVLLGELFARHGSELEKAQKALVGLVARLHDALDDRQRDRLASMVERGAFVSRGFGW
jgi:Arc/MetJ-type ribon-helix-helix transcriptional regulator